jgi:hypothetical protein
MKLFNISRQNNYQTLVNINEEDLELLDGDTISDTSQDIERYEMLIENRWQSFISYICRMILILILFFVCLLVIYYFFYGLI